MTEWTNPAHTQAVSAYREIVKAGGHPRPPRSKWRRHPARRCSGGVVVVDQATGKPYTLPCACPDRTHDDHA